MSNNAEEAAQKLGMPLGVVLARVSTYRKKGILMKKMPRKNSRGVDVAKLNQKIREILDEKSIESPQKSDLLSRLQELPADILMEALSKKIGGR